MILFESIQQVDKEFSKLTAPQHEHLNRRGLLNAGYESPENIIIKSAQGPYMFDVSGNRYIDLGMGAGSMILGHAYGPIVENLQIQAAKGALFIQPAQSAFEMKDKMLNHLPSKFDGVVFCNSGSEATMRAIRMARAYSGKQCIALFSGSWHGGHESVLAIDNYDSPALKPKPKPASSGLPDHAMDDLLMLPYNKHEAIDLIRSHADKLALLIVEPLQGSNPRSDIETFLHAISVVCQEEGIILAFDEVITGYRISLGGAIETFGITPDIVTFGKIIGGGLPIGAIAFTEDISTRIFRSNIDPFFTGGTFSANPLAMSVGLKVIECLETQNYQEINDKALELRRACNSFFLKHAIPMQIIGNRSISRIIFTNKEVGNRRERDLHEISHQGQQVFRKILMLNGIFSPSNGIIFMSFSHNIDDVEEIITAITVSAKSLYEMNYFNEK
jgi:glutamate-1-semialdehyde 2,1-aminomutase